MRFVDVCHKLTSMETSRTEPSRRVILAKAARPDVAAGFLAATAFAGALPAIGSADFFASAGIFQAKMTEN